MEFCSQIVPRVDPEYIPVMVHEWCRPSECFPNVERMVRKHGGKQVNGWSIWQWANILVEAEAHAVWESPEGKLVDITPHNRGEKEILFLRDDRMVYSGQNIGNIKMALTDSPLIAELIQLTKDVEEIMNEYEPGTEITVMELQQRLAPMADQQKKIIRTLNQEVKGNEFCSCQSGLKYKKCCGRGEELL